MLGLLIHDFLVIPSGIFLQDNLITPWVSHGKKKKITNPKIPYWYFSGISQALRKI